MSHLYPRTEMANEMASQLLNPSVLDEGLRSGLFISGLRRTGKTTFLQNDLIPALEQHGAIVIYVDLWSDHTDKPGKAGPRGHPKDPQGASNPSVGPPG
ncbi:hypothetical protein [Thiobacillus denitrificans]|uniref:hypothetical protein n=1 Tax=Thiobacillus denitrificans TaxID=36861 RepID=UPI000399999A|nr:hypothetical protein [Thiobacillus denitrificans]